MGGFHKENKTIILAIIIIFPNKNPQGYKEREISFIGFSLKKVLLPLIG